MKLTSSKKEEDIRGDRPTRTNFVTGGRNFGLSFPTALNSEHNCKNHFRIFRFLRKSGYL